MDSKRFQSWLASPETRYVMAGLNHHWDRMVEQFKHNDFKDRDSDLVELQRRAKLLGEVLTLMTDFDELRKQEEEEDGEHIGNTARVV